MVMTAAVSGYFPQNLHVDLATPGSHGRAVVALRECWVEP
jgi:hypothetical protein